MAVNKRTRYEVMRRDNFTCRYCRSTENQLVVDHVTPVALGGTDEPSNLVAACRDCNSGKASTSPDDTLVADVKAADEQWSGALKRAAELLRHETDLREAYYMAFLEAWPLMRRERLPDGAEWSVGRIYDAGLPCDEMVSAARYAANQRGVYDRFNYFMGICWKKVTQIQETAKQILATEAD